MLPLPFACPRCRASLTAVTAHSYTCSQEAVLYHCVDGIWRFLLPERAAHFAGFIREYETVRRAEQWGSDEAAYYRALPFKDLSGRYPALWRLRAKSFAALLRRVIDPMAPGRQRPRRILDLGAGNGWLSYRLAQRGHQVAAVDLLVNDVDGLGTHGYYDAPYTAVQAEFNRLPFADETADIIIFNGSFHYAADYEKTLRAVLPILRRDGRLVIMDSPVYHDGTSGARMARERGDHFEQAHGFRGDELPHENYLTFARLDELAGLFGWRWQRVRPAYGWRWRIRPWLARLRGGREPATFLLLVTTPPERVAAP